MILECQGGRVLAIYDDGTSATARAGAYLLTFSGALSDLPRFGAAPPAGMPDTRDYAVPTITADILTAYAASARYAKTIGGFTYKGHPVTTDADSRGNMTGAVVGAQVIGSSFSTKWKGSDGSFFTLDGPGMTAMATAVLNYVNACYAAEATIVAAITAGTMTTTAGVDAAAWPANSVS